MAFDGILVTEIFHSLQGESSLVGLPFAFIRMTGCNLRCSYCDSTYAFKNGRRMSLDEIEGAIQPFRVRHVLLTGGEPLLQRNTPALARRLQDAGYEISIETHGEISIEPVRESSRIIMDIKTPGSGMCREGFRRNLALLKPSDEVKFVITSEEDYRWAKSILETGVIPTREILFSPAGTVPDGALKPVMDPAWLAARILEDRLPVRFQLQLHKILWGNRRGV